MAVEDGPADEWDHHRDAVNGRSGQSNTGRRARLPNTALSHAVAICGCAPKVAVRPISSDHPDVVVFDAATGSEPSDFERWGDGV
jgi:hypothetical protein